MFRSRRSIKRSSPVANESTVRRHKTSSLQRPLFSLASDNRMGGITTASDVPMTELPLFFSHLCTCTCNKRDERIYYHDLFIVGIEAGDGKH
jgi:hypothetical protein